jgi:heme/copper-type cytochrome/quinol oxidase subunit 2
MKYILKCEYVTVCGTFHKFVGWYNGASGCSEPKRTREGNALIIIIIIIVVIINVILFFIFFFGYLEEKGMYKS